ncbi:TNF receptor-associated factor 3 [Lingula anatina]|uniref:TNF receptor-associated factor 3 n=1 Tax=Lingula anatina TaxID=7574 RepID=A0A1S3H6H1_LINAN|nr:TNF receptor-associated factor 3 [Lingula anatina]|eukprot:XP_013381076.1 TNF receptor-associated factor 3 [Lingula anatina]
MDARYKCVKCNNMLRRPLQTSCGHRMCDICVDELFAEHGDTADCPGREEDCDQLRKNDPKSILKDACVRREMGQLKVFCPNKNTGCAGVYKWKDIKKHVESCEYRPLLCPLGCGHVIAQKELEHHEKEQCPKRPVTCPSCGTNVLSGDLQEHIEELCLEALLSCPHCGSGNMKRLQLEEHYKTCSKMPRRCPLYRQGCEFTGTKVTIRKHEHSAIKEHITILSRALNTLDFSVEHFDKKYQKVNIEIQKTAEKLNKLSLDNTVGNLEDKIKKSEKFLAGQSARVMKLEETLQAAAVEGDVVRQTIEIADIMEKQGNHERRIQRLENSNEQMQKLLASHDLQLRQHEDRMSDIALRFCTQESTSYDGTLIWIIKDYIRLKRDACTSRTLSLYSQPFYSSSRGYKMCARVFLNGDGVGKGTHLSLFFVIMRGDYDVFLHWPFQQNVTLALLAQDGSGRHLSESFCPETGNSSFKFPTSDMNVASGCPKFAPQNSVESETYLKDDTIFIKVVVDTYGLQEP